MHIYLSDLPSVGLKDLDFAQTPLYVPVNPIEYHGPHLPLSTDREISLGMGRLLHEKLHPGKPMIIGPVIDLGHAPAPGPGSVFTSYQTLRKSILATCQMLLRLPFKKIIFLTFHGEPFHNWAIHEGVEYLGSHGVQAMSPFNSVLDGMLKFDPNEHVAIGPLLPKTVSDEIIQKLYEDFHGGLFETSLLLFLNPQVVAPCFKEMPDCPKAKGIPMILFFKDLALKANFKILAAELGFISLGLSWGKIRPHPGYSGWPRHSSRELGQHFATKTILPHYLEMYEKVFIRNEKPPHPLMKWAYFLTLKGKLL